MDKLEKYQQLIEKARKLVEDKDLDEAIRKYRLAFEIMIKVEDLLDLALTYMENKNPSAAKEAIDAVINTFPEDPRAFYILGLWYEDINDFDNAIESYKKAIDRKHTYIDALFQLGRLYDDLDNVGQANFYYTEVLMYKPKHFWANLNYGSLCERNNYIEEAIEYTLKAYKEDPNAGMVTYNLGVMYAKNKEYDRALKYYLEEKDKSDCYIMTYLNLGLLYKDIYKNNNLAMITYIEGLQKDKDNVTLWYNLGCLYVIMGKLDDAFNCFKYAYIKENKVLEWMKNDLELKEFNETYLKDKKF